MSRVAVVGKGIHPGNGFIFGVPLEDLAKRCVALEEGDTEEMRAYSRVCRFGVTLVPDAHIIIFGCTEKINVYEAGAG